MTELRAIMFDTIRATRAGTISLDVARSINQQAATIIDSGRVEIEHKRVVGDDSHSTFIERPDGAPALGHAPEGGSIGRIVHRLR